MSSRNRAPLRSRLLVFAGVFALVGGVVGTAGAAKAPGFKTTQAPMLVAVAPRAWVDPIITTGEMIGGYRFEAVPDGVAVRKDSKGRVEVYVNHETSTVPFPYTPGAPTESNSQNDFNNAELSRLIIDRKDGSIHAASMVITSDEGYQRFCSNFLATKEHGFKRDILFTSEEAVDWVNRTGPVFWPAVEGSPDARQSGAVIAHDPETGETRPIWGMGRHNHENTVAIPGYKQAVLVSGDDTFTTSPSQSQLYSYIADHGEAVWDDEGDLWAFVSDDGLRQKYEDFAPGDATSVTGHFIKVPRLIATGRNPDGSDVVGADIEAAFSLPAGTYAVPTDGSFSRPPGSPFGGVLASVDGPQWVLERWSQLNDVFDFVRLEDIAYDKRNGKSNILYIVDSGRGSAGAADGRSTNGRVWKMVLDKKDPTKVTSLSILIEGDDAEVKTPDKIHQPDNIESTKNALYITEDPGSQQQFNFTTQLDDGRRTEARIWQYDLRTGEMRVVFRVDQSADEGPTDVDSAGRGNTGAWEASGIVDVSEWFGPGMFFVTVQAHSLWVEKGPGANNVDPPDSPDFTNKREGGQLLLVHVPGG